MTRYIWDVVSDNVLMETDDAGATTAVYTQEPDLYGELISQYRDGQASYYQFDGQGSTRTVTDESQNVIETATYSAFGEVVAKTSSITNPFGYKGALGYYTNPETGTYDSRARVYQPTIGRWLSLDPAEFIDGPNRYVYVSNNPINANDPSGLCSCCCCPEMMSTRTAGHYFEKVVYNGVAIWTLVMPFWVDVSLRADPTRIEGPTACKVEWFECSNRGAREGQKAGEWFKIPDQLTPKQQGGLTGDWFDMRGCDKQPASLYDAPNLLLIIGHETHINFVVRVSPSHECTAEDATCTAKTISFSLHIKVKQLGLGGEPPGTTFDPWPWKLTPELDPKQTPKGCEEAKIKW